MSNDGRSSHAPAAPAELAGAWSRRGEVRTLAGHGVFTLDVPAREGESAAPLLVLHGFPSSSFDFATVLDELSRDRRVLLFDMVGYGFSAKPDLAYTMAMQADVAMAFALDAAVDEVALLSHDMGDTVGGELLARHAEGTWPVEIVQRVVTNGSIYIEMAQLTAGQQLLLSLPDELIDPALAPGRDALVAALAATFSAATVVEGTPLADHVAAEVEMILHDDGNRVLARLIRYIEERRAAQDRFTGAIETHPSPLGVVWGADDPIAVHDMAVRLVGARPDAPLVTLDGVGHYPMVEAPERFAAAVRSILDR
jgi:pimeloyl-ACP methyl ester carboxylesterase